MECDRLKFFFPDSSDLVDPSFDFERETRAPLRVRQRDDLYAHEIFKEPPFDGLLVSKAIVEGPSGSAARYTIAQRQRLLREGVRSYFRLDPSKGGRRLETIGDCGAFSYVREKTPPYSVQEVLDFYGACRFDYGISVDHVILGFRAELDGGLEGINLPPVEWKERQEVTLAMAAEFRRLHATQRHEFVPIGVAQGWSPSSYAFAVEQLQKIGFDYIAIGGVVPLKTIEILSVLGAVSDVRLPTTRLHLLGVTRCEQVGAFSRFGVVSFDSTSPLRQAFKDDKDNYYALDRAYPAVRIPQTDGNPKLQKRILSGMIDQDKARRLERACLGAMRELDVGATSPTAVIDLLAEYGALFEDRTNYQDAYREVLSDRPWQKCPCEVCEEIGFNVIIFRGAERNRRRGFHNVCVFRARLDRELRQIDDSDS